MMRTLIWQKVQKYPNVIGMGWGYKVTGGKKTSRTVYTIFVKEKVKKDDLLPDEIIPPIIMGNLTDVVEVGDIIPLNQNRTGRIRPVIGGISVGSFRITAGTLGNFVRRGSVKFILSNNHVLADSNNGQIGDPIYQPGVYDGGSKEDTIAYLSDFQRIYFDDDEESDCRIASTIVNILNFISQTIFHSHTLLKTFRSQEQSNKIDAAIAELKSSYKNEILEIGKVNRTTEPSLNMQVKKSGRTTGLTTGKIEYLNCTVKVNYGNKIATFVDQIVTTSMSSGGDSGSLLVSKDNKAVGLLFAGSPQVTVHNHIRNVLDRFNVSFLR